jgi:hypothetical protein
MNNKGMLLIAGVIALLIIGGAAVYALKGKSGADAAANTGSSGTTADTAAIPNNVAPASIKSFRIARPNFIVTGDNLSKVEIWSGGTKPALIGTAVKQSGNGVNETWTAVIPAGLKSATGIHALGYALNGALSANMPLPSGEKL